MRVGIAYNTGEISKVVEFKAMKFGAIDSIAQHLFEQSQCLTENNALDLSKYSNGNHGVTVETLSKLHELYMCSTDESPITVVFYNDTNIKDGELPVDLNVDSDYSENPLDKLVSALNDYVESDDLSIRYMDDITTSSIPLYCVAAFKNLQEANDFFNDTLMNGWADTSVANVLFVLYKDLVVKHDKADYYASVYKLNNK